MARQKYSKQLPQVRVTKELYDRVIAVTKAQEMSVADIQRAALEYYCSPEGEQSKIVTVPIIGELVNGKLVLYQRKPKRIAA